MVDGHETHQKPRGFYIPIIRISLFSGADEFITSEGPSGLGETPLNLNQNNSEKICLLKNGDLEKKFQKIFQTQMLVIFGVNQNPSNGQSPNKQKTHIQDSEENSSFWKTSFCSGEIAKPAPIWCTPKMWDRLKQNSLGFTALAASSNLPKSLGRTGFHISSNLPLKKMNKPKNGKPPAVFISFPQITPMIFSVLVTPNKNKSFPNFVPLRFAWSW